LPRVERAECDSEHDRQAEQDASEHSAVVPFSPRGDNTASSPSGTPTARPG
jgi:hypothetical protein